MSGEEVMKCIIKTFEISTASKIGPFLMGRYKKWYTPQEFIYYVKSAQYDFIRTTESKNKRVLIFGSEIIEFSMCLRGHKFSENVRKEINSGN